ncbi:MAG: glycosyltransferase family 1 protein [Candidatus Fermentibacteraceae bacterium]
MSEKLRVGVDCRVLSRAGNETGLSLEYILSELAQTDTGCEFFLFSNNDFQFPPGSPDFHRVPYPGIRGLPGSAWLHLVLPGLLRKHKIDVFWGFDNVTPLNTRTPSVLTIHYLTNRLFFSASLRRCTALVTVSAHTMQRVLEAFPFTADKTRKVVNMADALSKTMPGDREEVLQRLGVSEPFILTMGSFEPGNNLPALIRAFACTDNRDHLLVITGESAWKTKALEKLRADVPPEAFSRVRMLRGVSKSDLKRLYMQAALFVLPSRFEDLGTSVVEAMKCGTPVLSPGTASLPEVGGDAVVCFDPEKQYDLLKKLDSLLRSPAELKRMGRAGQAWAARFTWRNTAEQLLQVLKEAAASERPGF